MRLKPMCPGPSPIRMRRPVQAKRRKKKPNRNLGNLPKHLPRVEQVIEPESTECPCGCGQMHKIGEDRTERLEIIPAQVRVIVDGAAQICLPFL